MQVKKKDIQKNIYKGAKKVFKEKGYMRTTMKDISKEAKVPIGNIYRYYENKEVLFDDIVFDIYLKLKYIHVHEKFGVIDSEYESNTRTFVNNYITIATSKPIEFKILFESSLGTKYENIVDELIDIRLENYKNFIKHRKDGEKLDDEFACILIGGGINSIIYICKKYNNNEKLLRYYLGEFDRFFMGGINDKIKENRIPNKI